MNEIPIYFDDEKWEKIEKELSDIKLLLTKVLAAVGDCPLTQEDSILSARDVARILSVDIATVYSKCVQGTIPHFKMGKRYKFRQLEINEWIEKSGETRTVDIDEYVSRYLQKHVIKG